MATNHLTQDRKDLVAAYLVTTGRALGPVWAGGFAAGMAFVAEVARRDPVLACDLGELVEQLASAYVDDGLGHPQLVEATQAFIRAWDMAG